MSPIPVHTASPINTNIPAHAFDASPAQYAPFTVDSRPNSTEPNLDPSPWQPPRAADSQPSNTAASTHNNRFNPTPTAPLQPADHATSESIPPLPQPGAAPSPYSISPTLGPSAPTPLRPLEIPQASAYAPSNASPPRVTAAPARPQTPTHSRPIPFHHPTSSGTVYTPASSVPSTGVTSVSTSPSYNYTPPSYTLPQPPELLDLSHPPGYQQDHHSSFDDKPIEFCQETDFKATLSPLSTSRRGAGILDLEWTFGSPNGGANLDNTVVQTAISWAKAAGKRLSMTEKQLWKTINGEEDGSY
ncbi:hypothetical protein PV04_06453 [Phialophora macrospora]|uniref:Uncharacterized protein n=1 Tax=Phialophora macrospora TaxID=1851006 RepID=A0A0D2G589_9EURO|nr:hypothetical protein PV04_06453 [Phialophora macrospora]